VFLPPHAATCSCYRPWSEDGEDGFTRSSPCGSVCSTPIAAESFPVDFVQKHAVVLYSKSKAIVIVSRLKSEKSSACGVACTTS